MQVWFYEAFEEEAAALRSLLPAPVRAGFCAQTIQESGHEEPGARLISVRTQSHLPEDWQGKLDAILSRITGYDHLRRLSQRGSIVPALGYLPRYCATSVAEAAILKLLGLLRRLPVQVEQFRRFDRDDLTGRQAFVNISRGELSPSVDLLAAPERGQLGGVGLDVYAEEADLAHALRSGGVPSTEAVQRKSADSVIEVREWLERGRFKWEAPTDG